MAETTAKKPGRKPKTQTEKPVEENTPVTQSAPATFTEEQVKAMIAEAVAKATAEAKVQTAPQIVQLSAETERVHFLWQAEVSDENIFEVGPNGMYGRIIGKTGSFYVPKSDLSRVMDAMFRLLLQKRWIIAVDGLTDEEREAREKAEREANGGETNAEKAARE